MRSALPASSRRRDPYAQDRTATGEGRTVVHSFTLSGAIWRPAPAAPWARACVTSTGSYGDRDARCSVDAEGPRTACRLEATGSPPINGSFVTTSNPRCRTRNEPNDPPTNRGHAHVAFFALRSRFVCRRFRHRRRCSTSSKSPAETQTGPDADLNKPPQAVAPRRGVRLPSGAGP